MRKSAILIVVVAILSMISISYAAKRGRYQRGREVYARVLGDCAKWWYRLGDITRSKGKWVNKGDLAKELGRFDDEYIRRWLKNPLKMYPHVNCDVGRFYSPAEVDDLIYYLHRQAHNPPVWPTLTPTELVPVPIRIVNVHKLLRQRLRTLRTIQRMRGATPADRSRMKEKMRPNSQPVLQGPKGR